MGKYRDCVLDGRRAISRDEMNLGMGCDIGNPRRAIDLDPWAF